MLPGTIRYLGSGSDGDVKESVGKFPEFLCEVTVISKVAILNTYLE